MLPSEVLDKAADLIEPEGAWIQGDWWDGTSPEAPVCWCAEGAIGTVAQCLFRSVEMRPESRFLERAAGLKAMGVVNWNDAPERTQAEVVEALRKAAELARSEGQ